MHMRNLKQFTTVKFQVISDLHIDKIPERFSKLENYIKPSAPNLLIAGDLGRVENYELYRNYLTQICKLFKKVILVPGNHEYYSPAKKWTFEFINKTLREMGDSIQNLEVLIDGYTFIDNIMIYGGTLWSYCPPEYKRKGQIYTKSTGKIMTSEEYNSLHYQGVASLIKNIESCKFTGTDLLVVTHYAPTFKGTLDPMHTALGPLNPKNRMHFSNCEYILDHPGVNRWIYGHTGFNGNYGKLLSNQIDINTGKVDMTFEIARKITSKL